MDRTNQKITIGKSKEEWARLDSTQLTDLVKKDSLIAIKQYFDGKGNGSEAKIAAAVLGIFARERQAANNERQLALLEKKFLPQ